MGCWSLGRTQARLPLVAVLSCATALAVGVPTADAGGGSGPKAINSCTTGALGKAVSKGGSWVFNCSGTIVAPKPMTPPKGILGPGFEVSKSLTLDVAQPNTVTLQGGQNSSASKTEDWRIFTVGGGVTLTL